MGDLVSCCGGGRAVSYYFCLLEALGQAVVATDANGKITFWNKAAEELFGWSQVEMVGQHTREAFKDVVLEGAEEVGSHAKQGQPWTGEATIKRRNGEFVVTILVNRPLMVNGKLCGSVGVFTDVSNLKWMQEVLEESVKAVAGLNEKLRVVDSLTRHDLRNKLTAINGAFYIVKKRHGDDKDCLSLIADVEKMSMQMLQILDFQRYYVQVGAEELREVKVEGFVREAVALFSDLQGIRLVNVCNGLTVLADSLLRQIFYNLIDNTLKYGETTRTITIRFEENGSQLRLIYEDDGKGVPQEQKSQLFTEGYGTGTGYGLYLIRRICEAYGWTIKETGSPEGGAQFTMTIPKGEVEGKKRYVIASDV